MLRKRVTHKNERVQYKMQLVLWTAAPQFHAAGQHLQMARAHASLPSSLLMQAAMRRNPSRVST
jgi:hypothetical protein